MLAAVRPHRDLQQLRVLLHSRILVACSDKATVQEDLFTVCVRLFVYTTAKQLHAVFQRLRRTVSRLVRKQTLHMYLRQLPPGNMRPTTTTVLQLRTIT